MTLLSQTLLSRHAADLDGFLHHPFFDAVQKDELPPTMARAYFNYERRFVEQAVVVFAHILTKAPTLSSRRHLNSILHGLLYDQLDLFKAISMHFKPATDTEDLSKLPDAVLNLCDGFTALASEGTYASGLAAMLVAEWTYANASTRIMAAPPIDPLMRNWFALHTEPRFTDGVKWLQSELDDQGRMGVTPDVLSPSILKAISLEIAFHDAPFLASP